MVELKEVKVNVTKEGSDIGFGTYNIVKAIQTALADGWQIGTDLPVIVMTAINEVAPMIQGNDKLSTEAKEELEAFVMGLLVPVSKIPFLFIKKEEVVAE